MSSKSIGGFGHDLVVEAAGEVGPEPRAVAEVGGGGHLAGRPAALHLAPSAIQKLHLPRDVRHLHTCCFQLSCSLDAHRQIGAAAPSGKMANFAHSTSERQRADSAESMHAALQQNYNLNQRCPAAMRRASQASNVS